VTEYSVEKLAGATFSYDSSLLGGRGRWQDLPYPLTEYRLTAGVENRFRLVCASNVYSYTISADEHSLTLIAVDGYDIQPLSLTRIMIHSGESFDFLLVPDEDTVQSGRYWLRVQALVPTSEEDEEKALNVTGEFINHPVQVKAILAYDNETGTEPTSSVRECTAEKPCRFFNCPFASFPEGVNATCLNLTDARSAYTPDWLDSEFGLSSVVYTEYFLNFAYLFGPPSINAVKFAMPRALLRPGQYDNDPHIVQCPDDAECQSNGCTCTHIKQLPYNETIQVLSSVLQCNATALLHSRLDLTAILAILKRMLQFHVLAVNSKMVLQCLSTC